MRKYRSQYPRLYSMLGGLVVLIFVDGSLKLVGNDRMDLIFFVASYSECDRSGYVTD